MSFVKAEAAVASTPATPQVNTLSSSSPALQLRQSNVKDALDYLNTVKSQFREQPVVYSDFLTMMQDFKQQR
jgi:paired amphipathic helix protein Sin3a